MGSYGDSRNEIKRRMFAFIYAINDIRINPGKKSSPQTGLQLVLKLYWKAGAEILEIKVAVSYDPVVKYVIAEVATNRSLFMKCRK